MPSRFGVAVVVAFWLATTAFVGYRDVYPRYFSDPTPTVRFDLTDEATHNQDKWTLYRETHGEKPVKIGGLTTNLDYVRTDDTFWFRYQYNDVKLDLAGVWGQQFRLTIPKADSDVHITRGGKLLEQKMDGRIDIETRILDAQWQKVLTANADLSARVVKDSLVGRLQIRSPIADLDQELIPVPVQDGQVLNPMMPVGRLRDVRPGHRWRVHEVNPLKQSISLLARQFAEKNGMSAKMFGNAAEESGDLIAEVRSSPETLVPLTQDVYSNRTPKPVECWVIDYVVPGQGGLKAATWVSVSDGRVMRQEATSWDENLRFEREY